MAFGIKYVPLSPGAYEEPITFPDLHTALPKFTEEQALAIRQSLQALICDMEAERERDMAITSPTRPIHYVPPKQSKPSLQVAQYHLSAQPQPTHDANLDFGFLDGQDDLSQFDLPPLTDDMDCDGSTDAEYYDQLDQLIAEAFPDGVPQDVHWSLFPELNHLISTSSSSEEADFTPSLELPEILDDSVFEDEIFQKSVAEFDAVFGEALSNSESRGSSVDMQDD